MLFTNIKAEPTNPLVMYVDLFEGDVITMVEDGKTTYKLIDVITHDEKSNTYSVKFKEVTNEPATT